MVYYFIVSLFFTVLFLWKLSTKNKNLPPGPIRWPILGSVPQMWMLGSKYPHVQLSRLAKKYGDIMSLGLGIHYTIVISSYQVIKDISKRSESNIERFRFQFSDHRSYNKNLGIIWSHGDVWNQQRKYTVKRLRQFGFGKTGSMENTMREEINCLVDDLRLSVESTNGIWDMNIPRLQAVPINILWHCVGGYRFKTNSDKFKRHLKLNSAVFEVIGFSNVLVPFPFLRVFPKLSGYEKHNEVHKECQNFMKKLIEDTKQKRNKEVEAENFLEVYLDEVEKHKDNPESTMTEEQLFLILMDLFLAATETTSAVMNWIILYLAMYPQAQKKARLEIIKCSKGGSELISLSQKSNMPYIRAFILESMRHPPAAVLPPARAVSKDIEYNGYTLPKGACLMLNFYTVFHDEDFWGDHNVFRPERYFVNDAIDCELVAEKVDRVCQFGFGSRMCPGETMAMDTLYMFIITLLSNFSIEAVEGNELSFGLGKPASTINPSPYSVKFTTL